MKLGFICNKCHRYVDDLKSAVADDGKLISATGFCKNCNTIVDVRPRKIKNVKKVYPKRSKKDRQNFRKD